MGVHRSVGLQWRLGMTQFVSAAAALALTVAVYFVLRYLDLSEAVALGFGAGIGLAVAGVGAHMTFTIARSIKLRLWDAGDFANRIARGELGYRLVPGAPDELGWLEIRLNEMAGHLETAVADLRRLAEQNERLAEQAGRGAALEERARLARDLHDTVNQQLFALSMGLATVRRTLGAGHIDTAQAAAELESLEQLARESHTQIREIILQLRPVSLERHGLSSALREYARRMAEEAGWTLEMKLPDSIELSAEVRDALFRVGQEALANIRKHAQASRVTITLNQKGDEAVFTVADDGKGFDPKEPVRITAVGIIGMKERLQEVGGTLKVTSRPGEGTIVTAVAPVVRQEGGA